MASILLETKSREDFELIKSLARKLRIKSSILSVEDKEDIGLGIAILKGRSGRYTSKEAVMKKLRSV